MRSFRIRRSSGMPLLGGARPPVAALSALLLSLAAFAALGLGGAGHDEVPEAVRASQQRVAEDVALAMRASLDESVTDLERVAALFNAGAPFPADTVLDRIGSVYQKWRGTAVIEIRSGRLLAARGEDVPLTGVDRGKLADPDALRPRLVRFADGEARVLSFALLSWKGRPQQLLVASGSLRLPDPGTGTAAGPRAVAVADSAGTLLRVNGLTEAGHPWSRARQDSAERLRNQLDDLAEAAAERTARRSGPTTAAPGGGGFPGRSGNLVGQVRDGGRTAAGYAALAPAGAGVRSAADTLGLTVLTAVEVVAVPSGGGGSPVGVVAAGSLLFLGGASVALLTGLTVRPSARLLAESRRIARGDLRRPVSVPGGGEAARIGDALERLRRQLSGEPGRPARRPRRPGAAGALAASAALILLWSAPLVFVVNRADGRAVPDRLVADQEERTGILADRVRRALNEGHADLASVASAIDGRTTPHGMGVALDRTVREHARYRSVYVLDADGRILARAGAEPHPVLGGQPGARPITVLDDGGEPVVTARVSVPGRPRVTVVGEFRIGFLNALLDRAGLGEVRLVDAERRVLGGNSGYRAFSALPSDRLDALVKSTGTRTGTVPRTGGVIDQRGGVHLAAAARFSDVGAAEALGWAVVSRQPAAGLALPEYRLQNRTVLAGLLGLTAGALCLGWTYLVVVRPLRELARQADALAGGDRLTALPAHHDDEVGAIARNLELIRRQLRQRHERGTAAPAGRS
ncbi:HAMP domain-containing protein [Streptomyces roseolus]